MDRLIFAVHLLESRAAVKLQKLESIIRYGPNPFPVDSYYLQEQLLARAIMPDSWK